MKKFLFLVALTIFSCHFSVCHAQWQDTQWTNGSTMIVCQQLTKSQVLFVGANYNDGGFGYLFNVKKTGTDSYEMKGTDKAQRMPKNKESVAYEIVSSKNFNNDTSTRWVRKEVNNIDLILCYQEGKLSSAFEQTGLELSEFAQDKIMAIIAGSYTSSYGERYMFSTDGTCIFKGKKTTYQIGSMDKEINMPGFVVTVDGKLYKLDVTTIGINIYTCKYDENDMIQKGQLFAHLEADKQTPRWSDTSRYPCSSHALQLMRKDALSLMRNEIYARHGWKFKSKDLNFYFSKCSWYKPGTDNSKIKLSEMELLNVDLLKYSEEQAIE